MKMRRCVLLSLALLTLGTEPVLAQQLAKPVEASSVAAVALPPELARVLTDYEAGWKTGDPAALARLFTVDGFVLPPGRPLVRGRAAIQKLYTGPGAPLSLRAFAYATQGDIGYIIGGYSAEQDKPDDGKFTLTLRKDRDGRWLIVSDMDNSNRRQL
jgi:ketosteroid isomerase-like protein